MGKGESGYIILNKSILFVLDSLIKRNNHIALLDGALNVFIAKEVSIAIIG